MALNTTVEELTPLERLRIRESLQDRWRDQVRRITLLSLELYDDLDAEEPTALDAVGDRPVSIEAALADARGRLAGLEDAMLRLDEETGP